MAYKFFTVPIHDSGGAESEMNTFLRSHRVLCVDRRWVDQGATSFWSFCVDYLDGAAPGAPVRGRVDYRERLSPADFGVYVELRKLRKAISEEDGVPVFMLFTNEQLAKMAETRATSQAAMEKIDGVARAPGAEQTLRRTEPTASLSRRRKCGAGKTSPSAARCW
jgi:superfamily II DNA helicase RecQ